MARLGKRERNANRDTIKGNLANLANLERPSMVVRDKRGSLNVISGSSMRSTLDAKAIMARTHTQGVHVGSNIKGSEGGGGGGARFRDQPLKRSDNYVPARGWNVADTFDSNRKVAARMFAAKAAREG